jgi:hypothetical protein
MIEDSVGEGAHTLAHTHANVLRVQRVPVQGIEAEDAEKLLKEWEVGGDAWGCAKVSTAAEQL